MNKTKLIFSLIASLILSTHITKGQGKTLYVIDSIPFYQNMPFIKEIAADDMHLYDDEIASQKIYTDSVKIKNLGFEIFDTVIVIETKEMLKRPLELSKIPNKKLFQIYNTFIYYQNGDKPYTGPFIDYNINGSIKERGYINNGTIEGIVYEYDNMGKIKKEEDFKNGFSARSYREFWPNGKIKAKYNFSFSSPNEYSLYTSQGLKIPKSYKKITSFINEKQFHSDDTYKTILKLFQNSNYRINQKSYDAFLFLGASLFYNGEVELAIQMLDSALVREPEDINSRICRLYCTIFKYENSKLRSIKPIKENYTFAPIDSSALSERPIDIRTICNDIHELKAQGYNHLCSYTYEDDEGSDVKFFVSIPDAEKIYCK
ncbi:MAG TPA: hypothetical protein VMW01_08165 [Williamwhitmania sp.]|nr:hypothetical protein [Williamwhitmania sp.]